MTKNPQQAAAPASVKGTWSRTWEGLVSPELSRALNDMGTVRRLKDRELLYRRGDPSSEIFGVRAGYLRLSVSSVDGVEGLIGLYGPGTWFGEVSFFDERPRPTDARAVGATEIQVVSASALRKILDSNPIWYRDFAKVLCNKLRVALMHIESTVLPTSVRVGLRVLDLVEAYGQPEADGIAIGLKLSQEELARMLGLTRQSVNKELREFERRGWLRLGRGKLLLLDVPALRQWVADGGASELLAT